LSRRFNRSEVLKMLARKILVGEIIFSFEFHRKEIVAIHEWRKPSSVQKPSRAQHELGARE
jgi:hypothetical protein